jgi:signal transduction histidine kinase
VAECVLEPDWKRARTPGGMRFAPLAEGVRVFRPCHGRFRLSTDRTEPRPEGPPVAGGLGVAPEILRVLDRIQDPDALERAALAFAVHAQGGGFEQAWRLTWNGVAGSLELRGSAAACVDVPLARFVEERSVGRIDRDPGPLAVRLQPERLGAAATRAWSAGVAPAEPHAGLPWAGAEHVGAVTLQRDGRPWAMIVGTWSRPADPSLLAVLETLAALCGARARALEATRAGRHAARRAGALAEAVRTCGSGRHLTEVYQRLARLAAQGSGAAGSALWVATATGPRLEVTQGPAGRRERTAAALEHAVRAVCEDGQVLTADAASHDPRLARSAAGVTSVVMCPARAPGVAAVVLACWDAAPSHRFEVPGFGPADVEFVAALADLAGLALDQAGRSAEAQSAARQRAELVARVQRLERLAWVGELAGRMAEMARPPLASIAAFARRAQRALPEGDPAREYLDVVVREGARLERLLEEQAGYAPMDEGALRPASLNEIVQEDVAAVSETLVRRRVRLTKKLAPDLPELLLDRERISRAVANMLESALEAATVGGRVRVETRRLGTAVTLEVAHDGARRPGETLDQLFVSFAGRTDGGAVVGLGVAQQIVREHGGTIRVRSDGEWGTVAVLTLPVRDNQDRRAASGDRRRARGDRRRPGDDARRAG